MGRDTVGASPVPTQGIQGTPGGAIALFFWRKTRAGGTCCCFPPEFLFQCFQVLVTDGDPNQCRDRITFDSGIQLK